MLTDRAETVRLQYSPRKKIKMKGTYHLIWLSEDSELKVAIPKT